MDLKKAAKQTVAYKEYMLSRGQRDELTKDIIELLAEAWEQGHEDARSFYQGGPKATNPYDKN